jgi:hypothetical protein
MLATALLIVLALPQDTVCLTGGAMGTRNITMAANAPARARSPLDSLTFLVGNAPVKVCYGRPSARGRTMIGGEAVPWGRVWRTGANEPTMIHTGVPLMIAGVHVGAGTWSLYTVPGEREWEIIVNRSYRQWGHENAYTDSIRSQEVGRGRVPAGRTASPVEMLTIRAEQGRGGAAALIIEWENSRIAIPVERMGR